MAIELTCVCGKFLQLPDASAGLLGQCPACGRVLPMPMRDASAPGAALPPGDMRLAVTAEPGLTPAPPAWSDDAIAEGSQPKASPALLDDWGEISRPSCKLWSPGTIGWVAFLCGPAGPLMMIAINFARLGMRRAAWTTVGLGLLTIAAVLALHFALPEGHMYTLMINVPLFLGIRAAAQSTQGALFDAHTRAGGETASGWSAVGLGVLGIAVFVGAAIAVFFGYDMLQPDPFGKRVDFGAGQEVYYTRGATEEDARALGNFLVQAGVFDGRSPAAAQVARDGERMIVAFILQPWALNDVQIQQQYGAVGQQASAQAFAGRPVEVWLCNEVFEAKKKLR